MVRNKKVNTTKLRHVVNKLNHRLVPVHMSRILKNANYILKQEEIKGGGFMNWLLNPFGSTIGAIFGDEAEKGYNNVAAFPMQVIQEVPGASQLLTYMFPEADIATKLAPLGKYMYGDDTNQWLTKSLGPLNQDSGYKVDDDDQQETNTDTQALSGQAFIDTLTEKLESEALKYPLETMSANDPYSFPQLTPQYDAYGNVIPMAKALRYPFIFPDLRDAAKSVKDHMLYTERNADHLMHKQYQYTVDERKPYAFLDFPMYNPSGIPLAFKNISKNHYKRLNGVSS